MTSRAATKPLLQYQLFIRRRASATQGTPPGREDLKWVANTTTLVCGERDALLVDTFLSDEQTAQLADWIAASERRRRAWRAPFTVNPIAAALLADRLVGEPITPNLIAGLVVVFAGIWIATTERRVATS